MITKQPRSIPTVLIGATLALTIILAPVATHAAHEGTSMDGARLATIKTLLAKVQVLIEQLKKIESEGVMVGGAAMLPIRDIVDNAVLANNVTTLVTAVTAAGLVDTLKGAGPFTVFAPTNDAFAKLPKGTVESLVMPANKKKLTDILTYHVVPGRYTTNDLTNGLVLKTVAGKSLTFTKDNTGKISVNGSAMIETPNVISKNGVTHVIDTVLLPDEEAYQSDGVEVGGALMVKSKDIVDNALAANNVTTVVAALKAAGLVETLKGAGPFTVFAPDNNAFTKLPKGTVESLLLPASKNALTGILTYHVVPGRYTATNLFDGQILKTVNGKNITVKKDATGLYLNTAKVIIPNVVSSNGVTFVIDSVLLP